MSEPFIFMSYRRSDTSPYALALKAELEHRLRSSFVFVDIQRIQATDRWPDVLDDALERARVLIVLIGERWVECEECAEQPRLFDEEDWVRKEIGCFLKRDPFAIVPVLVDGAHMPSQAQLPPDIAEISQIQAVKLDSSHWHECVDSLGQVLAKQYRFELLSEPNQNPGPSSFRRLTPPISEATLEQALRQFLSAWRIENCYDRIGYGATSQWLVRTYVFPSFEAAMQFMQEGAVACNSLNHHPTWENCYKEVSVKLTTWNAAHRVTQYDVDLARRLDRIAEKVISSYPEERKA